MNINHLAQNPHFGRVALHCSYSFVLAASLLLLCGCVDEEPQSVPTPMAKPSVKVPSEPPFAGKLGAEFVPEGDERGAHNLPKRVRHVPTGMLLVLIPAGEYTMGTPATERWRGQDEALRPVKVARPFYLSETEVTVAVWKQFMQEERLTDKEKSNDKLPKSGISWHRAQVLVQRINDKYEDGWRLPTEIEWEFACRAGTTTPFSCGDNITSDDANFDGRRPYNGGEKGINRAEPIAVRSFPPNPWGLYDMHGNVWEWCSDFYVNYPEQGKVARGAPGDSRSMRGGGFPSRGKQLRSGYRDGYPPSSDGPKYGCRLAKSILPN